MKRILLPLIILIAGFGLAAVLIKTGPVLEIRTPQIIAPLVYVMTASPAEVQLSTSTYGTVAPRTESELIPEVSGRVVEVSDSMVSGGFFSEGDLLLRIDALDYEVALEQAKAGLARAQSDLANAKRAHARQLDLSSKQSTSDAQKDDALNRYRIAEATLREWRARLSRARRDLARTKILAPYDGRVRTERVDIGQFINRGTSVAMIYATDIAEVRLPIHDEELAFLDLSLIPMSEKVERPINVILRSRFGGEEHEWFGKIVRTEGELDPKTRMINLVASVSNPYATLGNRPPLSVGLFVEADIQGSKVDNVVVLPQIAIRNRNQVYVVDTSDRLRFRDVEVLRVNQGNVYIKSGLADGERVCTSTLESALDGMLVRVHINESDSRVATASSATDNES